MIYELLVHTRARLGKLAFDFHNGRGVTADLQTLGIFLWPLMARSMITLSGTTSIQLMRVRLCKASSAFTTKKM